MLLINTRRLTIIGMTAVVYTTLTLMLPFLSFDKFQLRFSEILNLLAFINPVFAPGIILGCFLSNLASPFGPIDLIVGTFATALTMLCIIKTKNLLLATLWPTIFSIFVGLEIFYIAGPPFYFLTLVAITIPVMIGEFIVVTVLGYPIFKKLMKNEQLMNFLKNI